jgi:hypothetical protein
LQAIHPIHLDNHWVLLVCALMQWALGALWYSPALFVKPWMAALGISPDAERRGLIFAMVSSFIGSFLLSFILWHVVTWAGATNWLSGIFVGVLCWLGFIAAPLFSQGLYERRPFKLFAINTGYWLVAMALSGALLATWR